MQLCELSPFVARELPLSLSKCCLLKLLQRVCSHPLDYISVWQWSVVLDNRVVFTRAFLKVKKNHEARTSHDVLFNTSHTHTLSSVVDFCAAPVRLLELHLSVMLTSALLD